MKYDNSARRLASYRLVAAAIATAAGLLFSPLAAVAQQTLPKDMAPANQQVLRLVTANMPRSLDPINIDAQRLINNGFADPLVNVSVDGATLIPAIGKSWALVEPTLWRIELQPNAVFWSGAKVDAAAVAASFIRHQTSNARVASLLKGVEFKAAGPTTLEIRTATADPAFLFKLVTLPIHNATLAAQLGDQYATKADLSGYFIPTEFVPGELIVGKPFDKYWGPKPLLSRIEARFVVDPQTRYLAMMSGEADMDGNVQTEQRRSYARNPKFISPAGLTSTWNIWMNYRMPIFQDKKMREALSLGIDRKEIVEAVMAPFAVPATGHFPAGLPYAIKTQQPSDPAKARQLLDELGWKPGADGIRVKDGKRLEFRVLTYGWWQNIAVALESQYRKIGVATTLQVVEPAASNQIMLDGKFEIATYCSCGAPTGDLAGQLSSWYYTDSVQNWGRYSNKEVDGLIDRLRTEPSIEARFKLAQQAQEIVLNDLAVMYVANAEVVGIAFAPRVRGVDPMRPRDITPGMYIAAQ